MGLLGDIFSTIDSAKRRGSDFAYGLLTDPAEVLRQQVANRNNEAGQHLGLLASLYQDDKGNPTFDPSKWSPAARNAEQALSGEMAGAMAGTVNWFGGAAPASMSRFAKLDADVFERPDMLTLHKVVVPKAERGQGMGTDFMQELTSVADASGKKLALSPSDSFGGSKSRLVEFYRRFGFVPNKGRNRDFEISESMYRLPKSDLPSAHPGSNW